MDEKDIHLVFIDERDLHLVFIDLKTAYDRVPTNVFESTRERVRSLYSSYRKYI